MTSLAGLGDVLTGLGDAFARASAAGNEVGGLRRASRLDRLSRFFDRSPAPVRGADRQARGRRPRRRGSAVGLGGHRRRGPRHGPCRGADRAARPPAQLGRAEGSIWKPVAMRSCCRPTRSPISSSRWGTRPRAGRQKRGAVSSRRRAARRGWGSRSPRTGSRCAAIRSPKASSAHRSLSRGPPARTCRSSTTASRCERTEWISDGRLARLQYHRAGAARSGVEPAALANNLILELPGATSTLEDLVARTERGLLLTCLWYIREVDPTTLLLTGLTRDGVYLVEHGRDRRFGQQLPFQREPGRPAVEDHRGGTDRTGALAGMERVAQQDGDAAVARGRVQHELGEPRDLTASARRRARPPARPSSAAHPACDEIEARLELRLVAVPRVRDLERAALSGSTCRVAEQEPDRCAWARSSARGSPAIAGGCCSMATTRSRSLSHAGWNWRPRWLTGP